MIAQVFFWAVMILCAFSAIGKLRWLATGCLPDREPAKEAIDVALNMTLAFWAFFLIFRG